MAFVKSKFDTIDRYKREVQNNMVWHFLTVHDEVDYIVDKFLYLPLLKQMVNIGTNKEIISKKLGFPYLNFLFDVEFDEWSSWTARKDVEIYEVPFTKNEHIWLTRYKKYLDKYNSNGKEEKADNSSQNNPEKLISIVINKELNEDGFKSLLAKIDSLPDGNDIVSITCFNSEFVYNRKVDFSKAQINSQENIKISQK